MMPTGAKKARWLQQVGRIAQKMDTRGGISEGLRRSPSTLGTQKAIMIPEWHQMGVASAAK